MTNDRSVNIGRDAVGNVITTGDKNKVDAQVSAKIQTLPPANSVDFPKELAAIRGVLEGLQTEHTGKIGRALDDATEELHKHEPDKNEIGSALSRALNYAKTAGNFAETVTKLAPHLTGAVAWLGSNWHHLLGAVGLAA
jgi:hypothetical protein